MEVWRIMTRHSESPLNVNIALLHKFTLVEQHVSIVYVGTDVRAQKMLG